MMVGIVDITNLTGMIFGNPDYLYAIIPILLIGIYYLKKSTKKVLILSRMIVLFLIIIALAAPYTLSTHTITNPHPTITILNDQTSSMDIFDASVADTICETIQDRNPAAQIRAFSGDHSPIGDKIVQYARGDDHIILISDGNSNYGRDLVDAVSVVARTNTTVYAIKESPVRNDMSVEVIGSKNIIVGNKNTFGIVVRQAGRHAKYELVVKVDDGVVYQSTIDQNERVKVRKIPQTFNTLGSHVLCAEIIPAGDDYRSSNNIFYKSVYVVPKPDIQLVTDEESNLRDIVSGLYNASVSANLKELQGIKTVILDNRYINSLSSGDIEALRNFVSDGHGLVVVGGDNSYDRGGYLGSDFEKILPVKSYPSEYYGRNDVVLVLDISGSMRDSEIVSGTGVSFLNYEKALANKILDDKEFRDDYVGVVAFGGQAYVVSPLVYFGNDQTRASLKDTIRTIEPTGQLSTPLEDGLSMAEEMLANSAGAKDVIILSDGQKINYESSLEMATQMKNKGIRMHFIHVISSPTSVLTSYEKIAHAVGASYYQTTYPGAIDIETGQPEAEPTPTPPPEEAGTYAVKIFTTNHFITRYLNLSASITGYNDVTPKLGAKRLVVTTEGKPVVCAWRYGLGRVVAFTTDNGNEWSSSLYTGNNSQLISSIVNWAIGDPRPEEGMIIEADDIFLGEACDVLISSDTIPNLIFGGSALDISRISENMYSASIDPDKEGVYHLSDYGIAVNYPLEYLDVGMNPDIEKIIQSHGGKVYNESEVGMLLSDVRRRSKRTVYEPVYHKLPFILAALALFLIEVILRRLREMWRSG